MKQRAIIINGADNVGVALADLHKGASLRLKAGDRQLSVKLTADVPYGHKFSLRSIERGAAVIKYGETIGIAAETIHAGDYVHTHNVESARGRGDRSGGVK